MMEGTERDLYRDLAFFAEDCTFADMPLRPLSLCSDKAMEMMGMNLMDADANLSVAEESRQMALFIWLHTAPLPEVCQVLWERSWPMLANSAASAPALVEAFRSWRARIILTLEACAFRVRPKPIKIGVVDDTPKDLLHPSALAYTIGRIASHTGFPRQHIKWHLFLPEAIQYYHDALRWNGTWTVPKGDEVTEDQVQNRAPDWMPPPPGIDTASPPSE